MGNNDVLLCTARHRIEVYKIVVYGEGVGLNDSKNCMGISTVWRAFAFNKKRKRKTFSLFRK